ncbi:MAG: class I SAM-dependent methyltransferase [Bacteroidota bacterium]
MKYDPIKRSLGVVFNKSPFLRKLFYRLLDLLLLRTWHVKSEARKVLGGKKTALNILDAGSGFGQYDFFLSNLCPQALITGVDVKDEQIDDCNQFFSRINRPNVKFEVGDLTKLNEVNAYDFILSVDVMEHIEEDVLVFQNFHRALTDNGVLLISTPSDQGGSDVHDHGEESFIEEHVRDGYNIIEIEEKLKKAGFSKVQARYAYGTPGHISWLFSMKYPIQMLGASKLFFVILPVWYLLFYPWCFVLNYMDVKITHKTGTGLIVKATK